MLYDVFGFVLQNTYTLVPFLAMAMATALPMPLLAPVIKKDRPATDTSTSFSIKYFDADSNAPLEQNPQRIKKNISHYKGWYTILNQLRLFSIVRSVEN